MMAHRVLISGDHAWDSMTAIVREIRCLKKKYGTKLIIIGGGAPGADTMCKVACQREDIHFAEVKALWSTRHKAAGPQRNTAMLWLEPHELVAFHANLKNSRGTKDMVKQAEAAGVPVKVVKR